MRWEFCATQCLRETSLCNIINETTQSHRVLNLHIVYLTHHLLYASFCSVISVFLRILFVYLAVSISYKMFKTDRSSPSGVRGLLSTHNAPPLSTPWLLPWLWPFFYIHMANPPVFSFGFAQSILLAVLSTAFPPCSDSTWPSIKLGLPSSLLT